MDDAQLMKAIGKDPGKGWELLIHQYSGLLWHIAGGILRDPEDIEETVADVFVEAWQNWHRFNPERGSLKSYLGVIALRRAIDRRRRVRCDLPLEEDWLGAEEEEVLPQILTREQSREVLDLVDTLKEPDRSLVIGRYFFGRSARELAQVHDLTPNTVDQRIRRALAKLRQYREVNLA
ncbi:ECF RNA polymerase sigma factor SigK [anaerobic digester metagenome]|nr:sigma-70 family RNA polymerase sigma factor [Clostridiaceae bacterium HFYG-1003]